MSTAAAPAVLNAATFKTALALLNAAAVKTAATVQTVHIYYLRGLQGMSCFFFRGPSPGAEFLNPKFLNPLVGSRRNLAVKN